MRPEVRGGHPIPDSPLAPPVAAPRGGARIGSDVILDSSTAPQHRPMPSYWLMKSEPDECSISDVEKAPGRKVPWIGVRNYQSRNLMRGQMRGGDSFFFAHGSYTAADGKWKGEVTNEEHSPTYGERPVWERKVVTIGFTGTYTDETAEGDGIALAGKQSIRFRSKLRLLVAD